MTVIEIDLRDRPPSLCITDELGDSVELHRVGVSVIEKAGDYIASKGDATPEFAVVLGSGLGAVGGSVENPRELRYEDIPGFPSSTVKGHAGKLLLGVLSDKPVMVLQGRFHYYEGYSMEQVVFPIRVMAHMGIKTVLLTNAAGGINRSFSPGDIMIIEDHISFSIDNPLRGANIDRFGPRFSDMSKAYTPDLRRVARESADRLGVPIKSGVYAFMGGPSFETPAEIRMLSAVGADAVGMSTVPEVITAAHSGMNVLGLSCITNMAAGVLDKPINHDEVIGVGAQVEDSFANLITSVVAHWN